MIASLTVSRTKEILPNSMAEPTCRVFRAEADFFLSSADCARIADSQSDCILNLLLLFLGGFGQ